MFWSLWQDSSSSASGSDTHVYVINYRVTFVLLSRAWHSVNSMGILVSSATRLKMSLTSSSGCTKNSSFFAGWQKMNAQQNSTHPILYPARMQHERWRALRKKKPKNKTKQMKAIPDRAAEES